MNVSERINRIKNKIESKGINLNSTLSDSVIRQFEEQHKLELPIEYRSFLLEIGNGGDGPPSYGLSSLSESTNHQDGYEIHPHLPFPLESLWVWEDDDSIIWGKGTPEALIPIFCHGHLFLGTDGCGMDWILIVTGTERGYVWNRADVGAGPCVPPRDFLQWYEDWLYEEVDFLSPKE